jgi:hypothetical protein
MQPTDMSTLEKIKTNAKAVDALLRETGHPGSNWSDKDYGPLLDHQLKASVQQDIGRLLGGVEKELSGIAPLTFGELFAHRSPPLVALKLAKDFAKRLEQQASKAYPPAVATTLYYAAIAAAKCHAGASISSLPKKDLCKGYGWAASQTWVSASLKRLFAEALQATDPAR